MSEDPASLGAEAQSPGGASAGAQETYVLARASIHLPRLPRGTEALVDLDDPYIQRMLEAGWLIPLGDPDELQRGD